MSTSRTSDFRGARGSNAGDQFHELWALQKALLLLDPSSSLTALTVEGVRSGTPEANSEWDGVDCTLYHGGKSIETSQRIVIAQLKYSAANPETSWTVARLISTSNKKADNSIIHRLAKAFTGARKRMAANTDLRIQLVSNQPVSNEVREAVAADWNAPLESATLNDVVHGHLLRMRTASTLSDDEFKEFLSALDFTEAGTSSRFSLREKIIQCVSQNVEESANSQVRELQTRVRELMMPERARDVITLEAVLGWFDIANVSGLFPAPSEFKEVPNAIGRKPAQELATAIQGSSRLVCLHGQAGCGKTTTIQQLAGLLPPSSTLVAFDCYGAGRYIYTDDRRHLPNNAFVQIANELSVAIGAPFLLPRRGQDNPQFGTSLRELRVQQTYSTPRDLTRY